MKFAWIVNNYGSLKDTIGGYSRRVCETLERKENTQVRIHQGYTAEASGIQKILSFQMTSAIMRATRQVLKEHVDVVVIEYPFIEWNPCILIATYFLRLAAHLHNTTVVLSLHEFNRMGKLRKIVSKALMRNSDIVFVTDQTNFDLVKKVNSNCFLRSIPSPMTVVWNDGEMKEYNREFIYFGLINSSKAFKEMLSAFSRFNADGKKKLRVYSSTPVIEALPRGVEFYYERSDEELQRALKDATYCILPIKPEVTLGSASLKAATQAGCTLIGSFSDDVKDQRFVINVTSYRTESFAEGFERAYNLPLDRLIKNSASGYRYSLDFSFEKTAVEMLKAIEKTRNKE